MNRLTVVSCETRFGTRVGGDDEKEGVGASLVLADMRALRFPPLRPVEEGGDRVSSLAPSRRVDGQGGDIADGRRRGAQVGN